MRYDAKGALSPPTPHPYVSTPAPLPYQTSTFAPSRSNQPAQRSGLTRRALLIGGEVTGLVALGGLVTDGLLNRARSALPTLPFPGSQMFSPILSYAHDSQLVWVARWSPD